MHEKALSEVTVRMTDTLKRDLQDQAALEDRKLSDTIRYILELYLYGAKHRREAACGHQEPCETMRGKD